MGGSTAINFCAFIVGSREDYNEWAGIVDDDAFAWPAVEEVLDRIKRVHVEIDASMRQYVRPQNAGYGPLSLTYGEAKNQNIHESFIAADQVGWPRNLDLNSGNPIGLGISPACFMNGKRMTAADAYLKSAPSNLTVLTGITIARISPQDQRAIATDRRMFKARKEIIVCCGAVKSPQLLMLSGIGEEAELHRHGIDLTHSLPQVGKNLQDHCFSTAGIVVEQTHKEDHSASAPTPGQRVPSIKGWFKLDSVLSSPEFQDLPMTTQRYLKRSAVPNWEIAMSAPVPSPDSELPGNETLKAIALIMNPQSRGVVSLRSNSPSDPPVIDPKFLSHPFDRRAIIEAMREMLRLFQAPIFKTRTIQHITWPEGDSDDAILEQAKRNLASSWHPAGTVQMGVNADFACVDHDFKVFGLPKLRVADMSICPLLPCNHTQSTAYLIGEIAAAKIIAEYELDCGVA